MAFQVKYRIEFNDNQGLDWKIDLSTDPWAGAITDLTPTADPLTFYFDNNSDEYNDPIRPTFVNIQAYSINNFDLIGLCSTEDKEVLVEIYADSTIHWTGFIDPGQFNEVYDQPPYIVNLMATDGLDLLKDIEYSDDGTPYTGRKTEVEILRDIFAKVHSYFTSFYEYVNMYDDEMNATTADSPLQQCSIDTEVFTGQSCFEVLTHILEKYSAVIRIKDRYRIFRPVELAGATVYGRYFTGDTTKSSTNFTPLQEINRTTSSSNIQQTPAGRFMMQRPLSKIVINQNYGDRKSWVPYYKFDGQDYATDNWPGWALTSGDTGDEIKKAADLVAGEKFGMYLFDNDLVPSTLPYNKIIIGAGHVQSASDKFILSFQYGWFNSSTSSLYSQFNIIVKCGSYYLDEVSGSENMLEWDTLPGNAEIWETVTKGWHGWLTYEKEFIGIPGTDDIEILIYGTQWLGDVYFIIKDYVIKATSAETTELPEVISSNERRYRDSNLARTRKTITIDTIIEKQHEATNSLNGQERQKDFILGDVIDSGLDNILPQFMGALAASSVSLSDAAADFVTLWASSYLSGGVVVTSSGADIIFTAQTAGVAFTGSTSIANVSGSLSGSVANTQANGGAQDQVTYIQVTGSSGTMDVNIGGHTEEMTFFNNIETTIDNFIIDHETDYPDYTLYRLGNDLYIEKSGLFMTNCTNTSGNLNGNDIIMQYYSAGQKQIDTVTLSGGAGTANITCDGTTKLATAETEYLPTSNWNTRGGSEDETIVQLIADEIAAQHARPKHLIQTKIVELAEALQIDVIGRFEDDLLTDGGSNRKYFMNRGKFHVKPRVWDIDLMEIL